MIYLKSPKSIEFAMFLTNSGKKAINYVHHSLTTMQLIFKNREIKE